MRRGASTPSLLLSALPTLALLIACDPPKAPLYDQNNFQYNQQGGAQVGAQGGAQAGTQAGAQAGTQAGAQAGTQAGAQAGWAVDLGVGGATAGALDARDAAAFDPIPFAVETRVGERATVAGLENRVTCQLLDQQGEPISAPNLRVEVTPDQGFDRVDAGLVGRRAREYEVTCVAPEYGLIDPSPALWTVLPAAPALTAARITDDAGVAIEELPRGGLIRVGCEAFDAYGNPTPSVTFEQQLSPMGVAVTRIGPAWRIDRSGRYEARCLAVGVEDLQAAEVEVLAAPPSSLELALNPDLPIYRVGQVVEVIPVARDASGGVIREARVEVTGDPALTPFGARRFRLDALGTYEVQARVTSETEAGVELAAARSLVVDFAGPGIRCLSPDLGDVVVRGEGEPLTLTGQASDISGLERLTVDGVEVPLDPQGRFSAEVRPVWGLNVHDIVATSVDGESSAFCAYFAAPTYLREAGWLADALELFLGQGVVDDGGGDSPLRSVGDVLRRVINSAGLRDTVHQTALAQNPIVPNECRARVLGVCLFRLGVDYENFGISRSNELSLPLLDGGLRARVTLRDVSVTARLRGTLGNSARISTPQITIDLSFNAGLGAGGRANVSVRSVNEVTVGRLDSDFSGFITGFILELVFDAFEGLIRNTLTDTIRGFLERELDNTLTGLFSDVEVGELGSGFSLTTPAGQEVTLQLLSRLDTLSFSPAGIHLKLGTRFDGPSRVANAALGTPLLPVGASFFPSGEAVGASVQLSVVNQAMIALWRAGFFDAPNGAAGGLGANLPEGVDVRFSLPYPPLVEGVEGQSRVRVGLGPLSAQVVYPGFFDEPFGVSLAAFVTAGVRLEGQDSMVFDEVGLESLSLSLGAGMPALARERLEGALTEVLQRLVDEALNGGFPSLPLPQLSVPPGLEQFNLPPTVRLGLRAPSLTGDRARWRVGGAFGE